MSKTTKKENALQVLADRLEMKIRDTEGNRDAAEKLVSMIDLLPLEAVKAAANKMIKNGLTDEEKEQVTTLNKRAAQIPDNIKGKREQIEKLRKEIDALKFEKDSINEKIAKVYTDAGLEYKKPKATTGSGEESEARKEYRKNRARVIAAAKKRFPTADGTLKNALTLFEVDTLDDALALLSEQLAA